MKKITIIYWTSTGNTEMMAKAIASGSKGEDILVNLKEVKAATKEDIITSDLIALGCSAMGSEGIDDDMSSFMNSNKDIIKDKAISLFGSYDWGSGDWIEDWALDIKKLGGVIVENHLKINLRPDEEGLRQCEAFGKTLQTYVLK